jgi:hypothetical protein
MDLYIYYRVRADNADLFQTTALAMQHNLARDCGIVTALKRRPDEQDGMHTWMEVYLTVAGDFEMRLNQAVAASRLSSLIDGERHTEQFLDVPLCA